MQFAGTTIGRRVGMSPLRFRGIERRYDPLTVTLVFFLFLALAFQLLVRLKITDQGYQVAQMRQIIVNNDTYLRQLHYDYNLYTPPQALRERAKSELGMGPITPIKVRRFDENGVIVTPILREFTLKPSERLITAAGVERAHTR